MSQRQGLRGVLVVLIVLAQLPLQAAAAAPPPKGSIGDLVWEDLDGDGVFDAGEPGLGGVTVELLDGGATTVLASTVTDGTGAYDFTKLPAGDYLVDIVEATLPAGAVLTSGVEPIAVSLANREDFNDADFGSM